MAGPALPKALRGLARVSPFPSLARLVHLRGLGCPVSVACLDHPLARRLAGLLAVPLLLLACSAPPDLSGRYEAWAKGSTDARLVILELKSNGEGNLKVNGEAVPFKWDTRGQEIVLHTKTGGALSGHVEADTIRLTLPSAGELALHRVR